MPEPTPDFYVGYAPAAPPALGRWLRLAVALILALGVGLAGALSVGQSQSAEARYEFGVERDFAGWIQLDPVPVLVVPRPTAPSPTGASHPEAPNGATGPVQQYSRYLLTVFGKHGAGPALAAFDGEYVELAGQLLWRDERTMLEVSTDSVRTAEAPQAAPAAEFVEAGEQVLEGEIVDSKCFMGVMKPGRGKTHRACATRCIEGGVPPVLLVRNSAGYATYYLLLDQDGGSVGSRVGPLIAEPVRIRGRVAHQGELTFLFADPDQYERL